ncbi:MAG: type II secretion system F family protein [Ilumatobacteraceae bacterium]
MTRRIRRPPTTAAMWAALLDTTAAEVRSGASLSIAWTRALERHGLDIDPNPGAAARRTPRDPDEAVVVQVVGAAVELGGPIAATLDAGAALLRERLATRADAAAHAAQARLSARVLTAVPLVFAAWSAASSSGFRTALLGGPGAVAACLGAGLNLAGWRWMRHIVERVAR